VGRRPYGLFLLIRRNARTQIKFFKTREPKCDGIKGTKRTSQLLLR
jgi:hypothetical protein